VSTRRRLEALEARAMRSADAPEAKRSDARRRMVEHLDRMARLKRGELGPEEAAEVEAANAALEARLARMRGEG
jgi:cytochrome c556